MASPGIGFTVSKAKKLFFDSKVVVSATERAERRSLSKFGAFVRKSAQRSMRPGGKKNKSSRPGRPPRTHGARLLRKLIFFVYEPNRGSVVIGPAKLNAKGGDDTAELMEHGGEATRRFFVIHATDGNVDAKGNVRNRRGRTIGKAVRIVHSRKAKPRRVTYRPRPFMGPAFKNEQSHIPKLWKNSVK